MKNKAASRNRHGLPRRIPADVRRQVRQECGFGCVRCGQAIVQYEHIDPPFAAAHTHNPSCIALLCGSCHDQVTRGLISKGEIVEARASPKTFEAGCARAVFMMSSPFELMIGSNHFANVRCVVRKGRKEEWFKVEGPERPGGPVRLSAKFYGQTRRPELEIRRNEWLLSTGAWDISTEGPVIEVRHGTGDIALRLRMTPPHRLILERLKMILGDTGIVVAPNGSITVLDAGSEIELDGTVASEADSVFLLP